MENKSIFFILMFSVMLFCISTVSAEDIQNNDTLNLFSSDELGIDDESETGSLNDLQKDIDKADDVINLTKDYTCSSNDITVKIDKKITINGNNHIIDAKKHGRIFTITCPHVTINNLTFVNGYSSDKGGAIYTTWNDIKISNCKFINNTAHEGGAIYASNNAIRFNLINCEFINNKADLRAGALYCAGYNSEVLSSTFIANVAQNGGSIYWGESKKVYNKSVMYGNEGRIINSKFINNSACNGGAVFWFANAGKIADSEFKSNYGYSSDNGGAIYWKGENGVINNTRFIENIANCRGGAIYWEGYWGTVTQSNFTNNTAVCAGSQFRGGGAIMWKGKHGLIEKSQFNYNTAYTDGGAIHWYETNDAKGQVSKCTFEYNCAYQGSAIFVYYGDLDINDSVFLKNLAVSDEITSEAVADNGVVNLKSVFTGNDNMINAIHNYKSFGYKTVTLTNVTYWDVNGVSNTNNNTVSIDEHESGIKINFEIYERNGNMVKNLTVLTDSNGLASTSISGLKAGDYTVKAIHYEDEYYTEISNTNTLKINKLSTVISAKHIWDKALTYDDIYVNVIDENNNNVLNGTCVLIFEEDNYTAEVNDGIAVFKNVKIPLPGHYDESIRYLGNEYYKASTGDVEITVLKLNTYTTDHNIRYISQHEILVEVTVVDEFGNPVLSGTVELDILFEDEKPVLKLSSRNILKAGKQTYYCEIDNGKAIFDIVLPKNGHYLVDAYYLGDKLYNPSQDETEADSYALNTTVKTKNISAKANETRNITCDIVDSKGNPVKNGTAILNINGKKYETIVEDGKAIFSDVFMPEKDTSAIVNYLGNDDYNPSNSTFNIIIENNETEKQTQENTSDDNSTINNETDYHLYGALINPVKPILGSAIYEEPDYQHEDVSTKSTGNPIFVLLLVLLSLICNSCYKRRK